MEFSQCLGQHDGGMWVLDESFLALTLSGRVCVCVCICARVYVRVRMCACMHAMYYAAAHEERKARGVGRCIFVQLQMLLFECLILSCMYIYSFSNINMRSICL